MMLQPIYFLLCIVGTVLPYSQVGSFLLQNGLNLPLFVEQLFATPISSAFGLDVVISAIVLLIFIVAEGTRLGMKRLWIYIASTFLIGVSLGLPLFLLMRQRQLEATANPTKLNPL
ncbi:DUF2834 domain-containing protein [Leptolyngbya sp. NK1-12]|nr:DUF2834 domain-containing protein [Leptolyngbya sp. NK1-12]